MTANFPLSKVYSGGPTNLLQTVSSTSGATDWGFFKKNILIKYSNLRYTYLTVYTNEDYTSSI